MRLDQFLYGILLASLFMFAGSMIFGNAVDNYGLDTNTSDAGFNAVYDVINETYDLSMDMKNDTLGAETEGGDESWESLVKGAYSATRLIGRSFVLAGLMINYVADTLGVPEFFVQFASVAMAIAVIFAIIYLIYRFKG